MKKNILWLLIIFPLISISQELWFPEGTTWVHTVNSQQYFGWAETKLIGDHVIDGQSCKRFERRYKLYDTTGPEIVFLGEDNLSDIYMYASTDDNQVYYYNNGDFMLMYDFTKQVGEEITLPYPEIDNIENVCPNSNFEITAVGTEVIDGISLKYLDIEATSSTNYIHGGRIYQKIGSIELYFTPFISESVCSGGVTTDMNFITFFRCYDDSSGFSFSDDVVDNDFNGECYYPTNLLSIKENRFVKVNIFPNPTTDKITITTTSTIGTFEIIDINGKLLKKVTPKNISNRLEFDFSTFSKGVYFLKERNSNSIFKIIKQ